MSDRWRDESEFRAALQVFISGRVAWLAKVTGRSESYWHKVADGTIALIPDDIVLLTNVTGDYKLIEWIVNRLDGVSLRVHGRYNGNGKIHDEIMDITASLGHVIERYREAYADNRVTGIEKESILKASNAIIERAAQLLEEIKAIKTT